MKYMAIDLETTGLTPMQHGITEFAAVVADDTDPSFGVKTFYRWLDPEGYVWSTYCLALHANWIGRVTHRIKMRQYAENDLEPKICLNMADLAADFMGWFSSVLPTEHYEFLDKKRGTITGTGKNFGSFDLQFLKAWKFPNVFRHRTLDWVPTYTRPGDRVPPELKTCKERAIEMGCLDITSVVAHNALDDAMDVHKLIQFGKQHDRSRTPSIDDPRQ